MKHSPLVIVGAGPAGIAAATLAAEHGVDVTVLDDQSSPGGQVYRRVSETKLADPASLLGAEYVSGKILVDRFLNSTARYLPRSTVWSVDQERNISFLRNDTSDELHAKHLILTVGSQERPMPFPGWQFPGVMTAGAAQIMLKSEAMLPQTAPVLVGSGPLLLLLAWQYVNAGVKVKAIIDTTPYQHYIRALPLLPKALASRQQLLKGVGFIRAIRSAGIPIFRAATRLHVTRSKALNTLHFSSGGRSHRIDTELVFAHQGVIPQLQLAKLAGCELAYQKIQKCWSAVTDLHGESSVANIYLAGDGQEIAGAESAEVNGRLCALNVLKKMGLLAQRQIDDLTRPLLLEKKKQRHLRQFLDTLYSPEDSFFAPSDDTIVCRCEEVTAGTIRKIAQQGCQGPNQAKSFSRCGMGHCQGRFCEATVSALIAREQNRTIEDVGYYRVRPPIKPLTLGQLGRSMRSA